ncbi:hypothetical protein BDN72DRAFT_900260 [Pluteus cervinus]|uniref:Uncharacterized protein n=1 Tax=Pluteus cervinus TaxID=181527 RepID=A0ACD3AJQ7_9AGAR|nr:hypothetical protein BDN72DRAFT_900260 [Pluteus cervinus]
MTSNSSYASPPELPAGIVVVLVVAATLFIIFLWFYLSPLYKDKNVLKPRFKLFSRHDLEASNTGATNICPDPTLPLVVVDGHHQYRLLTLLPGEPRASVAAGRSDHHNPRDARQKQGWSWQTFDTAQSSSSSNRNRSTLVSLDSDWCSEVTIRAEEDVNARREWKMKYWRAREKQHELNEEKRHQEADKTPKAQFDFSMVSEEDRVCLFAYQSESGQSTPNVLSPKQPLRSPPTIGPVKNPRIRTLLPNTAFSRSPHLNYSRALAGNSPPTTTLNTRLGIGYGYERQVLDNASPLGPPFGGSANICAYTQQFQEPPPAYQSPILGGIPARQDRSVGTPTPMPLKPNTLARALVRTPTQTRPTNPFLPPEEVMERSKVNDRSDARTPLVDTLAVPAVNEGQEFLEASRSRSCPNFSGIFDDLSHFDQVPTSTPFRRDEKQWLLSSGDYLDDAEPNITAISSIGSRLYDIHIEASIRDEDTSGLEYPPSRGTALKGSAHAGGAGGIVKRFSSTSDLTGFFAKGRKTFAGYKPFNPFVKAMGRSNVQVDDTSE